jgi:hypothetical protein
VVLNFKEASHFPLSVRAKIHAIWDWIKGGGTKGLSSEQ